MFRELQFGGRRFCCLGSCSLRGDSFVFRELLFEGRQYWAYLQFCPKMIVSMSAFASTAGSTSSYVEPKTNSLPSGFQVTSLWQPSQDEKSSVTQSVKNLFFRDLTQSSSYLLELAPGSMFEQLDHERPSKYKRILRFLTS